MNSTLTWAQRWILRRICAQLVIQGPQHKAWIIEAMTILFTAARHEFNEDTGASLRAFLYDCWRTAWSNTDVS